MDATIAKEYGLPELDFTYDHKGNEVATFEIGPFIFTVKKKWDEYAEYEGGKGTDLPEDGAIRHGYGNREWKWFVPEMTAAEHYRELMRDSRWTVDDARHEASKYVMQDYHRWEDYGNGWSYISIIVAIIYEGHEIGSASCSGIESDSDDEHILTIAWEDMAEAINEALNELDRVFKDPPSYLLVELDAKLDAAFKAAYDKQRAAWTGPSFAHKPFDPANFPRDPKDIPEYVPVDEREYRIITCSRCNYSNITDDEDRYSFHKDEFTVCSDCYYDLYEQADQALQDMQDSTQPWVSFPVWQVELKMTKMYKEESNVGQH